MRKALTLFFLILITSVTALSGRASLAPFDRDEARYIQASKQMFKTRDAIAINFQDTPRLHQPAGIYWLESGSVWAVSKILETDMSLKVWPYRIPSLIAANISVILTFLIGSVFLPSQAAFLAAALLSVTILFSVEAHLATVDSTMLAFILGMMFCITRIYCPIGRTVRSPFRNTLVFWILAGASLMLKGPVAWLIPMSSVLSLSVWERDTTLIKKLGFYWGWIIALVIVVPWVVEITHQTHGDFLNYALGHNFAGKITSAQESHGFWPGYYLAILAASFWPGILFLCLAIPFVKNNIPNKALRLLICWVVPSWILLELIPTKLPHYVMPTFPALCLIAASIVTENSPNALSKIIRQPWLRLLYKALVLLLGSVWLLGSFIISAAGLFILYLDDQAYSPIWIALAALGFILIIIGAIVVLAKDPATGLLLAIIGSLITEVICFGVALPNIPQINFSREITRNFKTLRQTKDTLLASITYKEPSLVFMAGEGYKKSENIVLSSPEKALELTNKKCALVLSGMKDQIILKELASSQGISLIPLKSISGFNYSNGHEFNLTFFQKQECRVNKVSSNTIDITTPSTTE